MTYGGLFGRNHMQQTKWNVSHTQKKYCQHTLSQNFSEEWKQAAGILDALDGGGARLRGSMSQTRGGLALEGAPSPVPLPVHQQAEPQIPVTTTLKVQIIILFSFPQLASKKTADSEPEHIVLPSERPCGLLPKAQERAKNRFPAVWSPRHRTTLRPAPWALLPASQHAGARLILQQQTLVRKRRTPPQGRKDDHPTPRVPMESIKYSFFSLLAPKNRPNLLLKSPKKLCLYMMLCSIQELVWSKSGTFWIKHSN